MPATTPITLGCCRPQQCSWNTNQQEQYMGSMYGSSPRVGMDCRWPTSADSSIVRPEWDTPNFIPQQSVGWVLELGPPWGYDITSKVFCASSWFHAVEGVRVPKNRSRVRPSTDPHPVQLRHPALMALPGRATPWYWQELRKFKER